MSPTLTLGISSGVIATFLDRHITIIKSLKDNEAALHENWRYIRTHELEAIRPPVAGRFSEEALLALNEVWSMVDSNTELDACLHPFPSDATDGDDRSPMTASVLLKEGQVAFQRLLATDAGTNGVTVLSGDIRR